jgi:hypothetical protein
VVEENPQAIQDEHQQQLELNQLIKLGKVKTKKGIIKNLQGEVIAESNKIK